MDCHAVAVKVGDEMTIMVHAVVSFVRRFEALLRNRLEAQE